MSVAPAGRVPSHPRRALRSFPSAGLPAGGSGSCSITRPCPSPAHPAEPALPPAQASGSRGRGGEGRKRRALDRFNFQFSSPLARSLSWWLSPLPSFLPGWLHTPPHPPPRRSPAGRARRAPSLPQEAAAPWRAQRRGSGRAGRASWFLGGLWGARRQAWAPRCCVPQRIASEPRVARPGPRGGEAPPPARPAKGPAPPLAPR